MTIATITATSRFDAPPAEPFYAALGWCGEGFYGRGPDDDWPPGYPEGARVVGWRHIGDLFSEPTVGPIEAIVYPPGGSQGADLIWRGLRVLSDSILSIDHVGGFGGIALGADTYITVEIRQSGAIIYSETQVRGVPGLGSFQGVFTIGLTNIVAAAGDEFEVSVINAEEGPDPHWAGFAYYAAIAGELIGSSHFRITGETTPSRRRFLRGHVTFR